jgi:hypothetical protein
MCRVLLVHSPQTNPIRYPERMNTLLWILIVVAIVVLLIALLRRR